MGFSKANMDGSAIAFSILPCIAVACRFRARRLNRIALGIDDWLMVPALVCSLGVRAFRRLTSP